MFFVDPGLKIASVRYRDELLMQKLLPAICKSYDLYIFQQDGAPEHRACETDELLQNQTRGFVPSTIWPPNSLDLNSIDYKIRSVTWAQPPWVSWVSRHPQNLIE